MIIIIKIKFLLFYCFAQIVISNSPSGILFFFGVILYNNNDFVLRAGPYIGLFLIAMGTGGIKPCVSAFGGDQFEPGQVRFFL